MRHNRLTPARAATALAQAARRATAALAIILLTMTAQTAWANSPYEHPGSGTPEDPWQISTEKQWQDFVEMVNLHNADYGDKYYKLTADITVSGLMTATAVTTSVNVGETAYRAFRGNFDGGGHTLTFNFSTVFDGGAPFGYISGATISNLRVEGTITSSMGGRFAAGIVGYVIGNSTISDCTVSSTIQSNGSGAGSHGGLVGSVEPGATVTINRCIFNGSFNGYVTQDCGGFVGSNRGTVNITDCLCAPASIGIGARYINSFCKDLTGSSSSLTRAYRMFDGTYATQGTRIYAEAPDGQTSKKITIFDGHQYWLPDRGNLDAASAYYLHGGSATVTYGVTFDGTTLTDGTDYDAVIKNSSDQTIGTTINATGTYTLTVTLKGDYAGTMTKTFEVKNGLTGSGTSDNPYIIDSQPAWDLFAKMVSGAEGYTQSSFSGKVIKLTQDISGISTIAGNESHSFSGTFDGGGHTMNLTINASTVNGAAPFGYISGATIKDLTVTGKVQGRTHTAGLVGFSQGTNVIDGCAVNVAVTCDLSANRHIGGVVGHGKSSTLTIRNTSFGGSLWNDRDYAGGLMGWCDAGCSLTIENSLFRGTYIGWVADHFHPIAIRSGDAPVTTSDLGAYYTTPPTLTAVSNIVMSGTRVYDDMPDNEMCQQLTLADGYAYYIPANISGIETNYGYTGSDIAISYTVKAGNGNTLTEGTHYTVTRSYTNVRAAGGYAITFTGKGDYAGAKTCYFTVGSGKPATPTGLSEDPDIAYPETGHYYVNMPYMNTTTLTFNNSDVNIFNVYDDGGKAGNVKTGTSNTNDYLKLTAPAGCTFTVSGSVDLLIGKETYQYVAVYNGHETTSTLLANVGGNNTLGPVTSSGNTMLIYYHLKYPGVVYDKPGFALNVTINDPNKQYAVNVVTPDHGGLTASSATAKLGATVTLTATPATGYALDRLTVLDAAQQPVTVTAGQFTMPNGPVIAAATFLPVYSVSFNANGHGTAPEAQSVMQGNTATEPAEPTADGYNFGGWYTTSACDGTPYDFSTAVSAPVELFAKWTVTTYYLNYDLAEGTVATENPATYTIESEAITLVNPTRDGYTFAGWTGTGLTVATETVTIAQGSTGNRTYTATFTPDLTHFSQDGDTYTIHTAEGWSVFCDCLDDNDTYNRFSGKTVRLGADITVSRMAGSDHHDFCGTFDGQEHTLTFNYGTAGSYASDEYAAPFHYVSNVGSTAAAFRNLHVAGHIYTSAKYAAGLIAQHWGTVNVENCRVSTVIHSSVSGDGTHGGFEAESKGVLNITGCVFDGKLLTTTTNGTFNCGGFVGWHNGGTTNISNSLYAPADIATGEREAGPGTAGQNPSATFGRNAVNSIANSYYTRTLGTAQGKQARSITASGNATLVHAGVATEYSVSGITAYKSGDDFTSGILYDNVLYAGSGDAVSLTLANTRDDEPLGYRYTYAFSGGTADEYEYSADYGETSYHLTMPDQDVTVNVDTETLRSTGQAVSVSYVDAGGQPASHDAIALDGTETTLGQNNQETWYYVGTDITVNSRINLTGDMNLILADGCTLDVEGIYITQGNTLTIYAQSDGENAGRIVSHPTSGAAIGGMTGSDNGNIVIYGGNIEAAGADNCAGIGSADGKTGGNITIYGGAVTAKGGTDAAAIGGGRSCSGGTITIYGGTITANGPTDTDTCENGAGIGGGSGGSGGTITINGGTITTYSRDGAGIGGGDDGDGGTITINGGTITSNKVDRGQGARIGGGCDAAPGTITINGGTITTVGGSGAGIGGGKGNTANGTVTINGGVINASGSYGIGAGENGADVAITLGWTSADDCITASTYGGTVTIADGKSFHNGSEVLAPGTVAASDYESKLIGKTLIGVDVLQDDAANDVAALATRLGGKQTNIALSGRKLWKDGDWNTLVLPFTIDDIQADGCPLNGATVRQLSEAYVTGTTLTLNFSDPTTAIAAGTPYIVKWEGGTEGQYTQDPLFQGVTVSTDTHDYDTQPLTDPGSDTYDATLLTDERVRFIGTYDQKTIDTEDQSILFLGAANTLYYPSGQSATTIGPFRAYFKIGPDDAPTANARQLTAFHFDFGDETNAVFDLNNKEEIINNNWYSLDGVKLDGKPTKKGLYIHGGRKVVIK